MLPGSRYTPEFGVGVAVAKYADHLPLERKVRMMAREGLTVDSQTLWDQINAIRAASHPDLRGAGVSRAPGAGHHRRRNPLGDDGVDYSGEGHGLACAIPNGVVLSHFARQSRGCRAASLERLPRHGRGGWLRRL